MSTNQTEYLLCVDCGLKTGLALFDSSPRLIWYRSHHLPTPAVLKRFVYGLLRELPLPFSIVLEGGGQLAEIWSKEAQRRHTPYQQFQAATWRRRLLYDRQHRSTAVAKQSAEQLARLAIEILGEKRAPHLRHDTAEAILIGVYALLERGWLDENRWSSEGN